MLSVLLQVVVVGRRGSRDRLEEGEGCDPMMEMGCWVLKDSSLSGDLYRLE